MPSPYKPILDIIKPSNPQVMLNIGIRQGGEWDYFKEQLPDLRLVALEPNPKENFNFRKSHPNDYVLPYGVWNEPKNKTLVTSKGLCPSMKFEGSGPLVECVTLDWLEEYENLGESIFLWIDIEGSELEAFKGGTNLLSSGKISFIYTELRAIDKLRSPTWCVDTEVIKFLGEFGYEPVLTQQESGKEHYDVLFSLTGVSE